MFAFREGKTRSATFGLALAIRAGCIQLKFDKALPGVGDTKNSGSLMRTLQPATALHAERRDARYHGKSLG